MTSPQSMFPSFRDIPEAIRGPLLMQAALAKQSGYGRGYSSPGTGPTNYDGTPMSRRDIKENFHLRGLQRRADMAGLTGLMQHDRALNVLSSMPTGSQQVGFSPTGPQTDLQRAFAEKNNTASFLDMLRGDQPISPQVLRNQGLKQMYQGGQLGEDAAGMAAIEPDELYRRSLELTQAVPARDETTINVGGMAPQSIQEQAQDAVLQREGKPTLWGQKNPELYGFGIRPDQSAAEVGRLIDAAAGKDVGSPGLFSPTPPASEPQLSSGLLEKLQAYLRMRAESEPGFYTPGNTGGFFAMPGTKRGLSFLDTLIGAQEPVQPEALHAPNRENKYSPFGDKQYWERMEQVPVAPWDIFSTPK